MSEKMKREGMRRVLWFVGLYAASLIVFSAGVYLLRWMIKG
ncbi:MAG TPA: hypothetical protein VF275_02200 [Gammaproteobacteria bacterium]